MKFKSPTSFFIALSCNSVEILIVHSTCRRTNPFMVGGPWSCPHSNCLFVGRRKGGQREFKIKLDISTSRVYYIRCDIRTAYRKNSTVYSLLVFDVRCRCGWASLCGVCISDSGFPRTESPLPCPSSGLFVSFLVLSLSPPETTVSTPREWSSFPALLPYFRFFEFGFFVDKCLHSSVDRRDLMGLGAHSCLLDIVWGVIEILLKMNHSETESSASVCFLIFFPFFLFEFSS